VDAILACTHDRGECSCRKPEPGLLHRAAERLGVPLVDAVMIGDADSDVEAGRRAGTRTVRLAPDARAGAAGTARSLAAAVDGLLAPSTGRGVPAPELTD
jgi:D-glycero-D-manno-heptose 1,7-bisphosphate phosphatase